MPDSDRVRIEVGFEGGQVMSAYVDGSVIQGLEDALGTGLDGSFQLEAEQGRYTLALSKVVYVKRFSREGRVGFSGA